MNYENAAAVIVYCKELINEKKYDEFKNKKEWLVNFLSTAQPKNNSEFIKFQFIIESLISLSQDKYGPLTFDEIIGAIHKNVYAYSTFYKLDKNTFPKYKYNEETYKILHFFESQQQN